MPPASNLRFSRNLRFIVALTLSFVLCALLYTQWTPIVQLIPSTANPPPESTETTSAVHTGSNSYIPDDSVRGNSKIIPEKVWLSARFDNITANQREWTSSWTNKNPFYRQELLTDRSSETFVRTHFETRPDIIEVYETLPIPILRADLLRYLIILAEGGIWSDLDVTCEKPVANWVPEEYKDRNIDMIVGLEFDFEWRGPGTPIASQFCNWVFMARPSSRNLFVIVDSVIDKLKEIARLNHVEIKDLTLDMLPVDVVDVTGPKIMTVAILKSLGQLLGRPVDDRDFSGIKSPKLIGDVLIMPGNAFAALQNGYPTDQGDVLVTHHYEGSWKQADAEAKERKKQKQQENTGD